MKYKISEEPMKLREFGRNVEMMVAYCKELPDAVERNVLARTIVRIMANINPNVKEEADYEQKLWDVLIHLADYEIDIDLPEPFTRAQPSTRNTRPEKRMAYHQGRSRFRQYGQNVELMAGVALKMEEGDERTALIYMILNIMKMQIKGAEKDSNAELIVCDHLNTMTKGKIALKPEEVRFSKYTRETSPPLANYSNAVYTRKSSNSNKKKSTKKKR